MEKQNQSDYSIIEGTFNKFFLGKDIPLNRKKRYYNKNNNCIFRHIALLGYVDGTITFSLTFNTQIVHIDNHPNTNLENILPSGISLSSISMDIASKLDVHLHENCFYIVVKITKPMDIYRIAKVLNEYEPIYPNTIFDDMHRIITENSD